MIGVIFDWISEAPQKKTEEQLKQHTWIAPQRWHISKYLDERFNYFIRFSFPFEYFSVAEQRQQKTRNIYLMWFHWIINEFRMKKKMLLKQ